MSGYQEPRQNVYSPVTNEARPVNRTPSPTQSEIDSLNSKSLIDFRAIFRKDKLLTKQYLITYAIIIVVIVIGALFIFYHDQIVHAIQPAANWMHSVPGGWLMPIAIFFIISFPPLFGHEIVAIVCGLVWGLWPGFGITVAGTLLGEIGNFYVFRYFLQSRATEQEKKGIIYACIAKVVREGGFKVAIIVRYSAVPGHFTTAIFAVCGMNIFIFVAAALLSMPKQFITVYLGTLLESSATGTTSSQSKTVSYVVGAITLVVTIGAMWYIRNEVNRVKPDVIYARRKARQGLSGNTLYQNAGVNGSTDDSVFNPSSSDINTPFAPSDAPYAASHQKWDGAGRAMDHASDPPVVAPQPRRANASLEAAFVVPSRAGSAAAPGQPSLERTNTAEWGFQTNKADGPAYPLHNIPAEPFQNPFDNASIGTAKPSGLPSAPVSAGQYAFGAPQHSFEGGKTPTRPPFSSPPSYS